MELKKFKQFRTISELVEEYETDSKTKVEVRKAAGLFAVCINGLEVEYFKTKEAAQEAAQDAIEAMREDE
jgi:hypothetical protein